MRKTVFFVILAALFTNTAIANTREFKEWNFKVYLDDKHIGYHRFQVEDMDDQRIVRSDAQFNVKFLFFNAYRYQHDNRERWRDGCLNELQSRTDDNGKVYQVGVESTDNAGLLVQTPKRTDRISGCVKSFAYWDPSFLTADRLLNAQTGEYLNVEIEELGSDHLNVGGVMREALRYRLNARDTTIDLWYSPQREWLALETRTGGGRLRYSMQ